LDELKKMVLKFAQDRDWDQFHTPKNLAMSVVVEAAELQELFMWKTPEESMALDPGLKSKVEDEVGDVLLCLVNFAARAGIDPLEAAYQKIEKNSQKYPIEKARGHARKYDEL
jgi:NTP pyrophosphatase (non-canonical NTP hydrolase)